jgi:Flp pilus assembly protein TadB
MPDDKPRLGPFLRQYAEQDQKSPRERAQELLLAGLAAVGMLVVLVVVLLAFVRFPLPTFGVLAGVWGIGFVVLTVKTRRANARERLLREQLESAEEEAERLRPRQP